MIILDCLLHPGFLWSAIYGKTFIQNFYCQAATRGVLCKNLFLEMSQNLQEVTRARVSFLIKLQNLFIKKETLAQVFSCQFCEISKNIFSYRRPLLAASVREKKKLMLCFTKILEHWVGYN